MSEATRITEKGQATILHELREKYDLEPGDEVVWMDGEEGILVKKRSRTDARGLLLPEDVSEAEREEIGREFEARLRKKRETEWNAGVER
ncbi:MAG: AbrB/MazE/SpoVT family DNA-binding domain-containing protein [Halalkalicoccus sp.]